MADHTSKTPEEFRDSFETPFFLANWLDKQFNFDVDLAATDENSMCEKWYTEKQNSLRKSWHKNHVCGFLNPPYSDINPWIDKAIKEQKKGFTTVMIIPCPNGEKHYAKVLEHASEMMFITGRISFIAACDWERRKGDKIEKIKKGQKVSGNTKGTVAVVFEKCDHPIKITHYYRNELEEEFGE